MISSSNTEGGRVLQMALGFRGFRGKNVCGIALAVRYVKLTKRVAIGCQSRLLGWTAAAL